LLCFRESDGQFLWQHSNEKLPTGRVHDWELQGVCSAAYAEGDRLWYVTNRGHVVCLDAEGFYDGEDDGPVQKEVGRLFEVTKNDNPDLDKVAGMIAALDEGNLTEDLRTNFASAGMELPEEIDVKTDDAGKKWTLTAKVGDSEREVRISLTGPKLNAFKVITPDDKDEADVVWDFDMMKELGVSQHNMCSCSVVALGDILFVITSNGVDESHLNIPAPDAPSFMAMDKNSGEVFWTDKSPGLNILHGQWSSPSVAVLGGVPQVLFAGGDGWLRSFRADKGKDGKPELLWEFDANPKTSKWILGGRGTRNNIIATPVIYDGLVYVAVGQDPEHGEGIGHLWCIDPTKRGDVSPQLAVDVNTRKPIPHKRIQAVIPEDGEVAIDNSNSAAIWHYSEFDWDGNGRVDFEETMHRTIGTVAIKNDLLFISDFSGLFHCLDAKSGKQLWTYDMLAAAWGSPLIADDKVFIGDEDGDIAIFDLSGEQHDPIAEINMENSVYSTPVVANGVLYIANKSYLFAIAEQPDAAE
jgi:outer membrane protein assembly factor BamB